MWFSVTEADVPNATGRDMTGCMFRVYPACHMDLQYRLGNPLTAAQVLAVSAQLVGPFLHCRP